MSRRLTAKAVHASATLHRALWSSSQCGFHRIAHLASQALRRKASATSECAPLGKTFAALHGALVPPSAQVAGLPRVGVRPLVADGPRCARSSRNEVSVTERERTSDEEERKDADDPCERRGPDRRRDMPTRGPPSAHDFRMRTDKASGANGMRAMKLRKKTDTSPQPAGVEGGRPGRRRAQPNRST